MERRRTTCLVIHVHFYTKMKGEKISLLTSHLIAVHSSERMEYVLYIVVGSVCLSSPYYVRIYAAIELQPPTNPFTHYTQSSYV